MADSLEKFLNKNQPKSNQNNKFSDSSPTSSVFARLGFDFIPSDPNILELSPGVKKHLQQTPKLIKDWQADEMRNGTVNRETYFKNPVFNSSKSLQSNLQKIKDAVPTTIFDNSDPESGFFGPITVILVPALAGIYEQANVAINQVQQYIDHTDRLSNVVEIGPETGDLPHYQQAIAVGRQLMYIMYQTDDVQNNAPIIGTFTSLFVGPELNEYNDIIEPHIFEISNSIFTSIPDPEGGVVYSTNLTSTQIETITTDIKSLKNFVEKRRKHDENFWNKAQLITEEYQLLKGLNDGEVQKMLIDDYVGSEDLKEKMVTKDVPVEPTYNVSVSYDGTITYTPRVPTVNAISYPSFEERTTTISYTVESFDEIPEPTSITGVVPTYSDLPKNPGINDTYFVLDILKTYRWSGLSWYEVTGHIIGDTVYINSTGETYIWNGVQWVFESQVTAVAPIIALEEYIEIYSSNTINTTFDGYTFNLSVGAFTLNSENGIWTGNTEVTIINTGTKDYTFTGVSVVNFLNTEIQYSLNIVGTNTIFYTSDPNIFGTVNTGNSLTFTVSARNLSEGNTTDYGKITIIPGIEFPVKFVSNVAATGILLPASVSQNVGSSTSRLLIDEVNGPYRILDANSIDPDFWTWRNDSNASVTISSITDITPNTHNTDMTIEFYQANTPNTLNTNDSVLWYANVTPHVEFPNTFVYLVETTDGQERIITIGIDRGNVDDSNLYNEIINTSPDIVVTNSAFDIRAFGGKPNTQVTISGPNITLTRLLDANGNSLVANTTITANGTYTYVLDFAGTGHRRTITKAIFS